MQSFDCASGSSSGKKSCEKVPELSLGDRLIPSTLAGHLSSASGVPSVMSNKHDNKSLALQALLPIRSCSTKREDSAETDKSGLEADAVSRKTLITLTSSQSSSSLSTSHHNQGDHENSATSKSGQDRALQDLRDFTKNLQSFGLGTFETTGSYRQGGQPGTLLLDALERNEDEQEIVFDAMSASDAQSDISSKPGKSFLTLPTEAVHSTQKSVSVEGGEDDCFEENIQNQDEVVDVDVEAVALGDNENNDNMAVPLQIQVNMRNPPSFRRPHLGPRQTEEEEANSVDVSPEAVERAIDRAIRNERHHHSRSRNNQQSSSHSHTAASTTFSTSRGLEEDSFVFSDDNVTQQRRSLWGSNSSGGPDSILMHSTKPDAIQELCVNLRRYPQQGLTRSDPELLQKVTDFHRARYQRRRHVNSVIWGVLGMFLYVADLRVDLQWTEDASWRRINQKPSVTWKHFIEAHSPSCRKAYFVYLMEMVSIVMMTVAMGKNNWKFEPIQDNPMLGPSAETLLELGALNSELVVQENQWYRLVAPLVLHAGIFHLLVNMVALHFIGGPVERVYGTTMTTVIFLLAGVGGNLISVLLVQNTVSVGASGGLFGLLGLLLVNVFENWDLITLRNYRDKNDLAYKGFPYVAVFLVIGAEMMLNILVGFTPFVDNFVHLGGLCYGVLFGFPLVSFERTGFSLRKLHSQQCHIFLTLRTGSFLMGISLFILTIVAAANYDGKEPVCSSCRYATCVPFPFWSDDPWWRCDQCDGTYARWVQYPSSTVVTMTCPVDGDIVEIDLADGTLTGHDVQNLLPSLCREFCPH